MDGDPASVTDESEDTARFRNSFGFLNNRAQGEERNNTASAPALFNNGLVIDPTALTRLVTPENAAVRAMELDTARWALEQMRRDTMVEKQQMAARQRQIEEQENRLNDMTRVHQRRHQSRLAPGENTINPAVLFRTPADLPIGVVQGNPVIWTPVEQNRGTAGAGVALVGTPGLLAGRAGEIRVCHHEHRDSTRRRVIIPIQRITCTPQP